MGGTHGREKSCLSCFVAKTRTSVFQKTRSQMWKCFWHTMSMSHFRPSFRPGTATRTTFSQHHVPRTMSRRVRLPPKEEPSYESEDAQANRNWESCAGLQPGPPGPEPGVR